MTTLPLGAFAKANKIKVTNPCPGFERFIEEDRHIDANYAELNRLIVDGETLENQFGAACQHYLRNLYNDLAGQNMIQARDAYTNHLNKIRSYKEALLDQVKKYDNHADLMKFEKKCRDNLDASIQELKEGVNDRVTMSCEPTKEQREAQRPR